MAKVIIEEYRGFEITFSTDKATFTAWNDSYDTEFSKKSFSAIKKGVDDYINKNLEFVPFEIVKCYGFNGKPSSIEKPLKVVGIRKDGRLVYINEDGKKEQISVNYIKYYALLFDGFTEFKEQYDSLKKQEEESINKFKASFNDLFEQIGKLTPLSEKVNELKKLL